MPKTSLHKKKQTKNLSGEKGSKSRLQNGIKGFAEAVVNLKSPLYDLIKVSKCKLE